MDGKYAHCTRPEHAGTLPLEPDSQTYAHRLEGSCRCGTSHGPATTTGTSRWGEVTTTIHDYTDENGKLLFQVARFVPKGFSQRRPDGNGGWAYHLSAACPEKCPRQHAELREDTRRVLYHLPKLLAAAPDETIYVGEGEQVVHSLERLGLVATTNPHGAGKWRSEYNEWFRGHPVIVLGDNDDDGRAHVEQVADELFGIAREVRILEFPELKEHGDVSDWLGEQGATGLEDLKGLLLAKVEQSARIATPRGPTHSAATIVLHSESDAKKFPEPAFPDPIPFDSPALLPKFPMEALPAPIADFVAAVAESRQVPPDLPALLALGVLSAAAAGRFRVRVKDDYDEPVNLFIATVLGSGERKSGTLSDCVAPLEEFEWELQTRSAPTIAAAREKRELEEARLKHLRGRAARNDDADGLEAAAKAIELALNLTPVPAEPKLIVGDATVEKLTSMLAEQGGRIAHINAEAGIFDTLAGRYSSGRANFEVFLQGHAGDPLRVDRMGRRSESVPHPALTVVLTPQPSVLQALADEPQFRGRGLLARFLYALAPSLVGSRPYVESAVLEKVRAAYRKVIRDILEVAPPEEGKPWHVLRPSAAALDVWKGYYNENEKRQGATGDLRVICDWAGKAPGAALRIAGLLHLAEGQRQDHEISDLMMTAAWAIVGDYLTPHALEAFSMIGTDRNVGQARKIASWIARIKHARFSRRDAHQNFRGFGEPTDFDAPLRILENRFIIRAVPPEKPGPGRPPSPVYDVNPRFLNQPSLSFTPRESTSQSSKTQRPEGLGTRPKDFEDSEDKSLGVNLEIQPPAALPLGLAEETP